MDVTRIVPFRNYIHSQWCMTEFRIANQLVADGRKKFLIPLLYENLGDEELDADLKLYIETHTYTDCKDLVLELYFFSKYSSSK